MILYGDDSYRVTKAGSNHIEVWKLDRPGLSAGNRAIDWMDSELIYSNLLDVGHIRRLPKYIIDIIVKEEI